MIDVRASARFISEHARFVNIGDRATARVAEKILADKFAKPVEEEARPFRSDSPEQLAMWCLVLDSVNFCFWADSEKEKWSVKDSKGEQCDGYRALVAALLRGVTEVPLLDSKWLSSLTLEQTEQLFRGRGKIPLFEKRHRALRDIGEGLGDSNMSAWELIQESQEDVIKFIDTILLRFPLFRDETEYQSHPVGFYKRAQILCQDLSLELSLHGVKPFRNLDRLTAFADYKIPQLLRDEGVLLYDSTLSLRIDTVQELTAGSPEEVEIRGCTIHTVEEIRDKLAKEGETMTNADLDNILWTEAVRRGTLMKPYHRVRTTNY